MTFKEICWLLQSYSIYNILNSIWFADYTLSRKGNLKVTAIKSAQPNMRMNKNELQHVCKLCGKLFLYRTSFLQQIFRFSPWLWLSTPWNMLHSTNLGKLTKFWCWYNGWSYKSVKTHGSCIWERISSPREAKGQQHTDILCWLWMFKAVYNE